MGLLDRFLGSKVDDPPLSAGNEARAMHQIMANTLHRVRHRVRRGLPVAPED
jgi:hypothetical protein